MAGQSDQRPGPSSSNISLHPIRIRHCHVCSFPPAQDETSAGILAKLARMPVLTVGEGSSFMPAGGAIRLFLEKGRMKIQISGRPGRNRGSKQAPS